VDLGTVGMFTVFAGTSITIANVVPLVGSIGLNLPSAAITGFAPLAISADGQYRTSPWLSGKVYQLGLASPTPTLVTTAMADLVTAIETTKLRGADSSDVGGVAIGGKAFFAGVHKWGTAVTVATPIALIGSDTDVLIFTVNGAMTVEAAANVELVPMNGEGTPGPKPGNIFWQVTGAFIVGAGTTFVGTVMGSAAVNTGAACITMGRLLSIAAVTTGAANTVIGVVP
ncbi:hypothetical protein T492DRAFT_602631, partial [Pavlovales sp. CCMP2436]